MDQWLLSVLIPDASLAPIKPSQSSPFVRSFVRSVRPTC